MNTIEYAFKWTKQTLQNTSDATDEVQSDAVQDLYNIGVCCDGIERGIHIHGDPQNITT